MKKLWLGVVALSGVLASCGEVVVIEPVKDVTVSGYMTNYRLTSNVQDQNGNTIAAGSYVICDDRTTRVGVDVSWKGAPDELAFQFKGASTGNVSNTIRVNNSGSPYTTSSRRYEFDLPSGAAPLSLGAGRIGAQDIVVNPINTVDVKGYTYVRVQGIGEVGTPSNVAESVTQIPVVDCA